MSTLTADKDMVVKLYNQSHENEQKLLQEIFGKDAFLKITDRVKTFEDACTVLGVSPSTVIPASWPGKDGNSILAYAKLCTIIRALNEGWEPDWKNDDEPKWYVWFEMDGGSGFRFNGARYYYTFSYVGSRLCFRSRELAVYAAEWFVDLYREFFII